MRLSEHLTRTLTEKLNDQRLVVWYDGERAFVEFARDFKAANVRVVSGLDSSLVARRDAEVIYRQMAETDSPTANINLLIYLPQARQPLDRRTQDPFEIFAAAGTVFGEDESEQLLALARAAMPELIDQIDDLFVTSQPTVDLLDRLKLTSAYPLVEQALGTQSVVEVSAAILGSDQSAARLDRIKGARAEVLNLLKAELGFKLSAKTKALKILRDHLAQYILLSELAFDLPGPWPESLANVPRADFAQRDRIYAIGDRLRSSDDLRDAYINVANRIEHELHLRDHFLSVTQLGQRDTFAFEERQYFAALDRAVQSDDQLAARRILDGRRKSVWRYQPERAQLWQVAERCVSLLETAAGLALEPAAHVRQLVDAYTRSGGWSDLDRQQRLMEQSFADCADSDEVQGLIEFTRRRYREAIDRLQMHLLERVQAEGWPPEVVLRQTQVFDRFVAPVLERLAKVAYILADSLRFEMGRALADELASLGDVTLHPAAAALPTITPVGMAALMPGADGALSIRRLNEGGVPHIGARPLPDSDARMAYLAERYGDRFKDVTLGEWLDANERKRSNLVTRVDLLVVRVPDIDELGEHVSLRQARKHMSELLGDLKTVSIHLARLGFDTVVFAADHGHVLLPEVLPGDKAIAPEGQWGLSKRRSRLGSQLKEQVGTLIFKPAHLGIQTDATDFCVPNGFGVYTSDANYFHEGLSLPECIVPAIELKPRVKPALSGKEQAIEMSYARDRFTSQVIGLRIHYTSMFNEPLRIRLEAFDVADLKGRPVGEAADCEARDENTHEVTLKPNAETEVPLLISSDFRGEDRKS